MANTLTGLMPDIIMASDTVSRELVGFIPAVTRNANFDRVAQGQTLRNIITPAVTAVDWVPAAAPPDLGDQTLSNIELEMNTPRSIFIRWNGPQQYAMDRHVPGGTTSIVRQQLEQAFRTLTNEMEASIAVACRDVSRAYGTVGTLPFASNLIDVANVRKILTDNGAPLNDMQLVVNTAAGARMRTMAQLTKANEAGDNAMLRQGVLSDLEGLMIRESAQVQTHTAGTGASATTDTTGYAVGSTVITLASAGTGTVLAGDAISFAGDTEKYIVTSGDTDVSDGGTLTIQAPGLRAAIPAAATAITVYATHTRNIGFARSAILLANRLIDMPVGGDAAKGEFTFEDEKSKIPFDVHDYAQFGQRMLVVSSIWGVKLIKPEHACALIA